MSNTTLKAVAYMVCNNGHNYMVQIINPVEVDGAIEGFMGSAADFCDACPVCNDDNCDPATCPVCSAEKSVELLGAAWVNHDIHGNVTAQEGCSRCECGCKYWEKDRCVDCGTPHDSSRHDKED